MCAYVWGGCARRMCVGGMRGGGVCTRVVCVHVCVCVHAVWVLDVVCMGVCTPCVCVAGGVHACGVCVCVGVCMCVGGCTPCVCCGGGVHAVCVCGLCCVCVVCV